MTRTRMVIAVLAGLVLGAAAVVAGRQSGPGVTIHEGVLEGWEVVRDNETLLCTDPVVFIRARQIQCE